MKTVTATEIPVRKPAYAPNPEAHDHEQNDLLTQCLRLMVDGIVATYLLWCAWLIFQMLTH